MWEDEATGQTRMMGRGGLRLAIQQGPHLRGSADHPDVADFRGANAPKSGPSTQPVVGGKGSQEQPAARSTGLSIGEIVAGRWSEPIDEASPLSVLNDEIARVNAHKPKATEPPAGQLRPLTIPLMVSGGSSRTIERLRKYADRFAFEPVGSGGVPRRAGYLWPGEVGARLGAVRAVNDRRHHDGGVGTCTK